MNRTLASLTSDNSQDMILAAMNDARRSAQRAHDFELLRTEDAYLSTHMGGVAWTTGCKTTPGGGTAILMKRLDETWNYGSQVIGAATYYPRTTRIPFGYTGQFKRELPPVDRVLVTNQSQQNFTIQDQFSYAVGEKLFVTTMTTATPVKILGIKWLEDLTGSEDPDIFLTYFTDWFRYATVAALNVYLKEDEQFPIRDGVMLRLWETVKSMDGTIANMGESVDLN